MQLTRLMVTRLVLSIIVLAGGVGLLVFSQMRTQVSSVAVAANIATPTPSPATPPDTKTTWTATKLLGIKFSGQTNTLPIGVSEWTNTFQQKQADGSYQTKYVEVWSLPPDNNGATGLPDCYNNSRDCYSGGKWAGKYLWMYNGNSSYVDKINGLNSTNDRGFTTMVSLPVNDPSYHNTDTNSCSPNDGSGLGAIGIPTGCAGPNSQAAITTAPYSWYYGTIPQTRTLVISSADTSGGTMGTMIPIQWTVNGYFQ